MIVLYQKNFPSCLLGRLTCILNAPVPLSLNSFLEVLKKQLDVALSAVVCLTMRSVKVGLGDFGDLFLP